MNLKTYELNEKESQRLFDTINAVRPLEMNKCYLNTFTVFALLKNIRKNRKEYKICYGFMQVVSDKEKGYEEWKYRTYVRHAFLVDKQNKVVDISYIFLKENKLNNVPANYLIMKKFTFDEYEELTNKRIQEALSMGNMGGINLTFEEGEIKNEEAFVEEMANKGLYVVSTDNPIPKELNSNA